MTGHSLTVTPGPVGLGYADCSCGWTVTRASKHAANLAAVAHHNQHCRGGCNLCELLEERRADWES